MVGSACDIAEPNPSKDLLEKVAGQYSTILADPPGSSRTGRERWHRNIGGF